MEDSKGLKTGVSVQIESYLRGGGGANKPNVRRPHFPEPRAVPPGETPQRPSGPHHPSHFTGECAEFPAEKLRDALSLQL